MSETITRTNRFGALAAIAAATLAAGLSAALMGLVAEPAEAAFPGANGKIAFVSNRTTGPGVNNPTARSRKSSLKTPRSMAHPPGLPTAQR